MIGCKGKNRKLNNKGSTLVMVLVLVTFVTLLSVVVTTTAMTNFKMKNINKQSTKTFYTAEDAVDEIYAALGKKSMECFNEAYTDEISSVVMTDGGNSVSDNLNHNRSFRYAYAKKLLEAFEIAATTEDADYNMFYDNSEPAVMNKFTELLNSYIEDITGLKIKSVSNIKVTSSEKSDNPLDVAGILKNYKISFKNCIVEYKTEKNFQSYITFDGEIGMPDTVLNFVGLDTTGLTEFTKYALIGSAGIEQNSGTGTINGSAYAGKADGIKIPEGASITANGTAYGSMLVCAGDVTLQGTNQSAEDKYSSLTVSPNTELWTENIMVAGAFSRLTVGGAAYVNDDLQIDGSNASVTLSGEYYGYGYSAANSTTHNANSAILLNGRNVNLDMSGISTLVIAGRAYIDYTNRMLSSMFEGTGIDGTITPPFSTGDSVGYVGAQEIYLVPTLFLEDGKTFYSNPCSVADKDKAADILNTKLNSQTFFGYGCLDAAAPYKMVEMDGKVYFYLNFKDAASAEEYVGLVLNEDAYNALKDAVLKNTAESMQTTVDKAYDKSRNYVKSVLGLNISEINSYISAVNPDAGIYTNGSLVLASPSGLSLGDNSSYEYDRSDSVLYGMQYTTLRKVLLKSYGNASAYDVDSSIFKNFVDEKEFENYITNAGGANPIYDNGSILYACRVSDGNKLVVDDSGVFNGFSSGVIVCDGDVEVAKDFTGTIIASGTITIDDGVTAANAGDDSIFNLLNKEAHRSFAKIFKAWKDNSGGTSDAEMSSLTYKELVTFSTWRKYEDK